MTGKERVAILSAVVLVIGGGTGALMGLAYLAERYLPELNEPGKVSDIWLLVGLPLMLITLILGLLFGCCVWFLLMKPWFTSGELERYFTQPEIPLITPMLSWLFHKLNRK